MFERGEEYRPPGKLIRVTTPKMTLIWGSVLIGVGIIFVVVALTEDMEARRRRHQNVRLIRMAGVAAGMVTMNVGAGILAVGWRRRERLRYEGRTAQALVTGRWQQWRWTKLHRYCISYRFAAELPDGTTSTADCRISDPMLHHQLRIGHTFLVQYVPANLRIGAPVWHRVAKSSRRDAAKTGTLAYSRQNDTTRLQSAFEFRGITENKCGAQS